MRIPYKIVKEGYSFFIPDFDKYLDKYWELGDRKEKFINRLKNNPIDLSHLNHQVLSEISDGCYEFEQGDDIWELFDEDIYWLLKEDE